MYSIIIACQTPLHFLFSIIWLNRKNFSSVTFVWIDELDVDDGMVTSIANLKNVEILKLRGGLRCTGKFSRTYQRLKNINALNKLLKAKKFSELLLFNDLLPESQFLIYKINSLGGLINLGEDGVALYETAGKIEISNINTIFGRIVYGGWWSKFDMIGLNPLIKTVTACAPDLIRSEISDSKIIYHLETTDLEYLKNIFSSMRNNLSFDFKYILVIVPLINPCYLNRLEEILKKLDLKGGRCALKFHPRESEKNIRMMMSNISEDKFFLISKSISAESICLIGHIPWLVVGLRSSALHLIKAMVPGISVMFFEFSSNVDSDKWRAFYRKNGLQEYIY